MAPRCRVGPWTKCAICVLVQSIGGLFYMFGVFSPALKNESWIGGAGPNGTLTQDQLSLVSTAANIGGNIGTPVGLLVDRFGKCPHCSCVSTRTLPQSPELLVTCDITLSKV